MNVAFCFYKLGGIITDKLQRMNKIKAAKTKIFLLCMTGNAGSHNATLDHLVKLHFFNSRPQICDTDFLSEI